MPHNPFEMSKSELEEEIKRLDGAISDRRANYEMSDKSQRYNPILEERRASYQHILKQRRAQDS